MKKIVTKNSEKKVKTVAKKKTEKKPIKNVAEKKTKTKVVKSLTKKKTIKKKKIPTRQLLLETAGELFAEYGMKGTSIKMIADQSKQNIAAVNYHFVSKKNLFFETMQFVLEKLREKNNIKPVEITSKNFLTELEKYITSQCDILLSPTTPKWYSGLIVRTFNEAPTPANELAAEFFSPETIFLETLAKVAKPKIKPVEATLWAYTVVSQIIFYIYGRKMILAANNKKSYNNDFIKEISQHIFNTAKASLN